MKSAETQKPRCLKTRVIFPQFVKRLDDSCKFDNFLTITVGGIAALLKSEWVDEGCF